MISKELLSAVLKYKIWKVIGHNKGTNKLRYCIYPNKEDEPNEYTFPINLCELQHKCKKWAFSLSVILLTDFDSSPNNYRTYNLPNSAKAVIGFYNKNMQHEHFIFIDKTEEKAVIKASEWILKRINNV